MNILILGPQGSGKGTQAELLTQKFDLLYLDMGSYLRELAKTDSQIDQVVNKKGALLPDAKTAEIFERFLKERGWNGGDGLMLDGFPRTPGQYDFVKKHLLNYGQKLDYAVYLDISEKVSILRLSARRICKDCGKIYNLLTNPPQRQVCDDCGGELLHREDDKEEVIRERLRIYKDKTSPLIDILENEGILIKVDGERPVEEIFKDLCNQLV